MASAGSETGRSAASSATDCRNFSCCCGGWLFQRRKSENAGISGLSRFYGIFLPAIWSLGAFALILNGMRDVNRRIAAVAAYFFPSSFVLSAVFRQGNTD